MIEIVIFFQVESALLDDEAKFEKALEFHDRYRTLLRLPKFRIESSHDLRPVLQTLGLGNIFSADADFTGIVGRKGLVVDQVRGFFLIQCDQMSKTKICLILSKIAQSCNQPAMRKISGCFFYPFAYF